jgi:hypothetical protein
MLGKLFDLLKDGENFAVFTFLIYVILLTKLVGFFAMGWAWQS